MPQALGSMLGSAAAFAAGHIVLGTFGLFFQPADIETPDFGALFEIFPAELAGEIGGQLVEQGAGIVIAGDLQRLTLGQRAKRTKNARMAFTMRNDAHIYIGCGLGFGHWLAPRPRME